MDDEKHFRARKRKAATPQFLPGEARQKHRGFKRSRGAAQSHCISTSSFIRTVTVGLGISPSLLTSSSGDEERSRAHGLRRIPPVGNFAPP